MDSGYKHAGMTKYVILGAVPDSAFNALSGTAPYFLFAPQGHLSLRSGMRRYEP